MNINYYEIESFVELRLENYYGILTAIKYKKKYYLMLDSHSSTDYLEISKTAFNELTQGTKGQCSSDNRIAPKD